VFSLAFFSFLSFGKNANFTFVTKGFSGCTCIINPT